jgi:outer membrane immunogenic protein
MRHCLAGFALGLMASTGLSTLAQAADMAAPPPPALRGVLPASEKAIDWSGFYFGGTGSYVASSSSTSRQAGQVDPLLRRLVQGSIVETGINSMPLVEQGRTQDGRIGFGAFIGYNVQLDDIVLGVEADYTRAKVEAELNGSRTGRVAGTTETYDWAASTARSRKMTDFGTVRFRLGYAWDNWMPYVTAGLAYGRSSDSGMAAIAGTQFTTAVCPDGSCAGPTNYTPSFLREANRSKLNFGYALGAGVDLALTQNIFLRAEVQHIRFAESGTFGMQINQAKIGAAIKY